MFQHCCGCDNLIVQNSGSPLYLYIDGYGPMCPECYALALQEGEYPDPTNDEYVYRDLLGW